MASFNEGWIDINDTTEISLTNMDDDVVYRISSFSSSRSLDSERSAESGGKKVFRPDCSESYLPIPDGNKSSSFLGSDVGVGERGRIRIEKMKSSSSDMVIEESDGGYYTRSNGDRVWEECYHVDFADEKYRSLDKKKVAITLYRQGSGSGGSDWGYITESRGEAGSTAVRSGLFDFSDCSYINLFNIMEVSNSKTPRSQELIITNPVSCEAGVKKALTSKCMVLSFNPVDADKIYVIELDKAENVRYSKSENYNVRYVDGEFSGFVYELSSGDDNKTVCCLGRIENEVLLDISVYPENGSTELGSVVLREATDDEESQYNEHIKTVSSSAPSFEVTVNGNEKEESYSVVSTDPDILRNSVMTVKCTRSDGTYVTQYTRIRLRSSHTYGTGTSANTLIGPYHEFGISYSDILNQIGFTSSGGKDVKFTVTFEKSEGKIYTNKECVIFILSDNWEEPVKTVAEAYSDFTVPTYTRDGYTYEGLYYKGKLYKSGKKISLDNLYVSMVASWKKNSAD